MAKIILGLIAAVACFMLAESLSCNQCSAGIFGKCVIGNTVTCTTNTSVCFTSVATFPATTLFSGFTLQGCTDTSNCPNNQITTNGTLAFGLRYSISTTCCSNPNQCNPFSGAPSTKMTLSVALSAAAMAAFWGSFM